MTRFDRLARLAATGVGHPATFLLAVALVVGWAATGPLFTWSDGHSSVINTATAIVTFLVVFLLQASQSRDTAALSGKARRADPRAPGGG